MAILFSIAPLNAESGERTTLRFCDVDDERVTGLDDERWWPGIGRSPTLNRQVFDGSFDTAVQLAQASTQLSIKALQKEDVNAPLYRFAGAPMNIWHGPTGGAWGDYDLIFSGLVTNYELVAGDLNITAQVDSEPFEETFLDLEYDGLGGAGGVEDLKDKVKPAVFGYCRNVEPVMINTVDNVFQVHGYGSIEAIVMVYERAAEFGASVGNFATYQALVDADISEGQWGTCLAQGMFRLGAPPFGLITADVKGDNTGGFHQTTAAIIERLCEIKNVDSSRINSASLAAFASAVPYPINLYLTSPEKLIDILQRLVRPCNAQLALSWLGKLEVTRFGTISLGPVMRLDVQGRQLPPVLENVELNVSPPFWRMEMQANRNWRVQSKDEIAFEDDIEIPITVYRRYPLQPPTPTGNGTPDGWSERPLGYTAPEMVSGFPQWGPVWESTVPQTRGVAQGDWSQPYMFDAEWPAWVLISQNEDAKVTGKTRGVKADTDFDIDTDTYPVCFINRPVTGPWVFRCKVRGALDRVAVGITPFNPATLNAGWQVDNIMDGFFVAQGDNYWMPGPGVYCIQDFHPDSFMFDGSKLAEPAAEMDLEMAFNGQTVEHYIDGEHVRTHTIDYTDYGSKFWAMFIPLSPGAEIYDIQWGRAGGGGGTLEYPVEYMVGSLRRALEGDGWEGYAPELESSPEFTVGWVISKNFNGGAYAKARVGGPSNGRGRMFFDGSTNPGGFFFEPGGSFEAQRGSSTVATGSWAEGDEFAIKWDKKKIYYYKNGSKIKDKKVSSPPAYAALNLDMGHGFKFYEIDLVPKEEGEFALKGSVSDGTMLTPLADTSPTVTGGFVVIAETTDLVYAITSEDSDDVEVIGSVEYAKTGGSAASVTLQVQLQYSSNAGSSWTNLGSAVTGSASTGASQTVIVTASQSISGSSKRRYRLLAKNTVAGDFTASLDGSLLANWSG